MSGLVILSLKKYVLNKPETIVLALSEAVFVIVIEKSSETSKKSVSSLQLAVGKKEGVGAHLCVCPC